MNIYYLDERLTQEELTFLKSILKKRHGGLSFQDIEQIRIPSVLPAPEVGGTFKMGIVQRVRYAKKNLMRTNIEKDAGSPVIWVLPREPHWGTVFQLAIQEITGCFPFIVMLWRKKNGAMERSDLRFIDATGMVSKGNEYKTV